MEIRLRAHGAYHHQYHVVWIPKYRKKILEGRLKEFTLTLHKILYFYFLSVMLLFEAAPENEADHSGQPD